MAKVVMVPVRCWECGKSRDVSSARIELAPGPKYCNAGCRTKAESKRKLLSVWLKDHGSSMEEYRRAASGD